MPIQCITPERFWQKLDRQGSCWLWNGSRNADGYGRLKQQAKWVRAHRFAYRLVHGPLPDGLLVCHRCDVRNCCNPDHLFLGTSRDNNRDMIEKGRARFQGAVGLNRGEANARAKLSAADVVAIRAAHSAGEGISALARRYGLHKSGIFMIVHRRAWKHVPSPSLIRGVWRPVGSVPALSAGRRYVNHR